MIHLLTLAVFALALLGLGTGLLLGRRAPSGCGLAALCERGEAEPCPDCPHRPPEDPR